MDKLETNSKDQQLERLKELLHEGAKLMPLAKSTTRRDWFNKACLEIEVTPFK